MNPKLSFIPAKRLFTLKQSAEYLGRTLWAMREMVWSGKIPYIQDGKKIYLDVNDLDRYIENNKRTEIN